MRGRQPRPRDSTAAEPPPPSLPRAAPLAAVLGSTALTFEGVETAETLSAPLVAEVQRSVARELEQVEESVAEAVEQVEERVGEAVQKEEADYERALLQAETSGASKWQAPTKNM